VPSSIFAIQLASQGLAPREAGAHATVAGGCQIGAASVARSIATITSDALITA
jgi:hypothetical protein